MKEMLKSKSMLAFIFITLSLITFTSFRDKQAQKNDLSGLETTSQIETISK